MTDDPFVFMRNGGKKIVNFTVTNYCNASCVFCSFHREQNKRMVAPGDGIRAVDFWADNDVGMLSFTGGEPLLNPGLPEMVRHAERSDMITITGTNGILLTRELAGKLGDCGLGAMWISFESDSPEQFERNRGVPGLHGRISQAARDLRAAGVDFFAIALINKSLGDVEGLADRLLEMGFDKVKFDYPMGFELGSTYRGWSLSPLLRYSGEEMERTIDAIVRLKKDGRIRVLNPLGGLEFCCGGCPGCTQQAYLDYASYYRAIEVLGELGNCLRGGGGKLGRILFDRQNRRALRSVVETYLGGFV